MLKFFWVFLLTLSSFVGWSAPRIDVKTIPMDDIDFKSVEKVCKSLLTENGDMIYLNADNALLIRDTPAAAARIASFINHTKELLKEHAGDEVAQTPPEKKTADPVDAIPAEKKPEPPPEKIYKIVSLGDAGYGTVDEICRSWLSTDGKMLYSPSNNTVIISDQANIVQRIEKFITDLKKTSPMLPSQQIPLDNIAPPQNTTTIYVNDTSWRWGVPIYYYPRPHPWPRPHPRPRPRPKPHPPKPQPPILKIDVH